MTEDPDIEIEVCAWCNKEYEKSSLILEHDLGWLCPHCFRKLEDKGEIGIYLEDIQ